ncbi:MAG: FecR domain-containing protein [Lewinellaceae bacterium]|nr:FecR domain-containing protein [Lewinellaceae bacterium]MCB9290658.1 FecR domain-containing protein [Lewinellaceae bacterium]
MLFHKKLKGEINSREQKELSEWLQQESSRGLTEELEKTWNLSKRYKESYEPDVEAGLSRFQQRISASGKDSRNRPLKPAAGGRRRSLSWLPLAAAIALLATLGWWWMGNEVAPAEGQALIYTTGPGQSQEATLPDGSSVVLNENSFLSVSPGFQKASGRSVKLTGEAYFDIKHDPSRPFIITTHEARVKVLGTAFNLRAYPEEGFTEVEVEEGVVQLSPLQDGEPIRLAKGQRGACRPGEALKVQAAPGLNALSWHTKRLMFRNTPLSEALVYLERHFKVKLKLENREIANCGITMELEDITLPEVFKAFELIYGLDAEKVDGGYWLRGGRCAVNASEAR